MKSLLEIIKALYEIKNALLKKSENNNEEGGGNTDSKNLFLGYNIPDKLLYYEFTGENDEHGSPIFNNVYFDSFQEAIQYLESKEELPTECIFLYKDLTLDARNCYAQVYVEKGKYEVEYEFNFLLLNSTTFDTENPFTINGENYYKIDQ